MNHEITISESINEIPLAGGAGVLRRAAFVINRNAGHANTGRTGPFENFASAAREAARAADFSRRCGNRCVIRFNGQELAA